MATFVSFFLPFIFRINLLLPSIFVDFFQEVCFTVMGDFQRGKGVGKGGGGGKLLRFKDRLKRRR